MAARWSDVVADPDYQTLSDAEKRSLKERFYQKVISVDPDYQRLNDAEKESLRQRFFGIPATPQTPSVTPPQNVPSVPQPQEAGIPQISPPPAPMAASQPSAQPQQTPLPRLIAEELGAFAKRRLKKEWEESGKTPKVITSALDYLRNLGPSVESIEAQAQRTGRVPVMKVLGRGLSETAAGVAETIAPTNARQLLGYVASGPVASVGGSVLGAGGRMIGPKIAAKTPQLAKSAEAFKNFLTKKDLFKVLKAKTPSPQVLQPGVPKPLPKEALVKPGQPQVQPQELIKGPLPPAAQNIMPPSSATAPVDLIPGKRSAFIRDFIDRFDPIKYAKGKGIAPEFEKVGGKYTEAYVDARLLQSKTRSVASGLLDKVDEAVKPIKNYGERQLFNKIYTLRNYRDLDKIGKTTANITAAQAEAELARLQNTLGAEQFSRLSKVADDIAKIQNDDALDILIDSKVITKELADTLRKRYPNYLRSEILEESLGGSLPSMITQGEPLSRLNKSFLKTKHGTNLDINEDVLDVVRRSLTAKAAVAEKQKVIDSIVHTFGKEIGQTARNGRKLIQVVDEGAIPPGYVKSSMHPSTGKVIAVDSEIENLVSGLDSQQADLVTKMVGRANNLFRLGATTYRLPFVINNIARDVQEMLFKRRVVPGQKSVIGSFAHAFVGSVKEMFGIKDEVFNAWKKAGGTFGGLVTSLPKERTLPFRLLSPKEKTKKFISDAVMLPFESIAKLAEMAENTTRLAEFIRLSNTNLPGKLKGLASRDVTVDFEKIGNVTKLANKWIPFLNASIQGNVNSLRAFRDQPFISTLRFGKYIALPTVGLYAWNKMHENDRNIDPWLKSNFWYLNTGLTVRRNDVEVPVLLTLRKGEVAQQLGSIVESLLEISSDDPNVRQRLEEFNAKNIASASIAKFVPPLARMPIEQVANYSFFRGQPIIPESQRNVASGSQFTSGTSDIARRTGELTGLSPIRMEHVLKSAFPASQQIMDVADLLISPQPTIPKKKDTIQEVSKVFPFVMTPTGFYSPEKEDVRRFKEKKTVAERTPRFLFEQAVQRFFDERTNINMIRVKQLSRNLTREDQERIVKKVLESRTKSKIKNPALKAAELMLSEKQKAQYLGPGYANENIRRRSSRPRSRSRS